MTYRLTNDPTFVFEVRLHKPGKGVQIVKMIGRHFNDEDLKNLYAGCKTDREIAMKVIDGWERRYFDEEFSPEALEKLMSENPGADTLIAMQHRRELRGELILGN